MNYHQRDYAKRLTRLIGYLIVSIIWLIAAQGCGTMPRDTAHNAAGGYISACDDLPGLVGDDC